MTEAQAGATAEARAIWYVETGRAAVQHETLPPIKDGMLRVRTLASGISRGTEGLVFRGAVPASEHVRMRGPHQQGDFPFPVKYGYQTVGRVVAGPDAWRGRTVFVLHPHQTLFDVEVYAATAVPDHIPAERAVLTANLETALTAVWDGGPAPGDHIAVVGGGVVGALTAWLCGRLPGTQVELVDTNPARARLAADLGVGFAAPENARRDNDLVIHASASEAGLATAIGLAGDEATVVEMSWYGDTPVAVGLGGAFHSRRLKLVSTQVGRIPPSRSPRWDMARRKRAAVALLDDPRLDALLETPIAFDALPAAMPAIFARDSGVLCQVVSYPHG